MPTVLYTCIHIYICLDFECIEYIEYISTPWSPNINSQAVFWAFMS
jgi:hypothetical protein